MNACSGKIGAHFGAAAERHWFENQELTGPGGGGDLCSGFGRGRDLTTVSARAARGAPVDADLLPDQTRETLAEKLAKPRAR